MKKGITLIELVVSMAIFLVVITIAVGAYVAVSKTKVMTSNMKESQQKARIATEMISRLARQANKAESTSPDELLLKFNTEDGDADNNGGARFTASNGLYYEECTNMSDAGSCSSWSSPNNTLEGLTLANTDVFTIDYGKPVVLNLLIETSIDGVANNPYYNDSFTIDTKIIMENIK